MQIDLKLLPNRNYNKFGSNHTYLNSQAATQALALSLHKDGQGFLFSKMKALL